MNHKPLREQVIAIVGSASGIGRETALLAASRGAAVAAFDNDEDGLQSLVNEIERYGGTVRAVSGDVADEDAVSAFANYAVREFGRLDTWAHCAAVAVYARFADTTSDEFRRVLAVNLLGQIYGARAALPYLQRQGGALVHVSSIEARRSLPYHAAYASAKHGITGFIEAMRLELRHDHIPVSVTEILPASINTPFFDHAETKLGVKPQGIPPFYPPRAVAEAILYAAEHDVREIVVGGAGKMLLYGQRLSPALMDAALERAAFKGQRTSEPKSAHAPNNLYGPTGRDYRVQGDFGSMTLEHTFSTWLDTHPRVKALAVSGIALGVGALLAGRQSSDRKPEREERETVPIRRPAPASAREAVRSGGWH